MGRVQKMNVKENCITTIGYIIDLIGLNNVNLNDTLIVKIVLQDSHGLTKLMRNGDFFFVDRGFRDVKQDL